MRVWRLGSARRWMAGPHCEGIPERGATQSGPGPLPTALPLLPSLSTWSPVPGPAAKTPRVSKPEPFCRILISLTSHLMDTCGLLLTSRHPGDPEGLAGEWAEMQGSAGAQLLPVERAVCGGETSRRSIEGSLQRAGFRVCGRLPACLPVWPHLSLFFSSVQFLSFVLDFDFRNGKQAQVLTINLRIFGEIGFFCCCIPGVCYIDTKTF